jgi:hypothetical protein
VKCTYLGCGAEPTHTLIPQYGRASVWCKTHGLDALRVEELFSNRQTSGPRLTPGDPLRLPRPIKAAS